MPTEKNFDIKEWIFSFPRKCYCIAINWKIMGSSGIVKNSKELVLKRFNYSATQEVRQSKIVKSIVKPEYVYTMLVHLPGKYFPHFWIKIAGLTFCDAKKNSDSIASRVPAMSKKSVWSPVSLHHYAVKTPEELRKKIARGRGAQSRASSDKDKRVFDSYFSTLDLNDTKDLIMEKHLPEFIIFFEKFKKECDL